MNHLRLAAGICAFASNIAFAQVEDLSLEDLLNIEVTTATKKSTKLEESPGSMTVITRQQILDTNARTLRDVLNIFVPGMDVVPTYFRYGDRVSEGIYSRGLLSDFSQQILFLLNGMGKFNESTFSSAYPAIEFTLENVERVEISRSPIPLYGGSAITIINIITREQYITNGVEFFNDYSANQEVSFLEMPLSGRRYSALFGKPIGENWHISGHVQTYSEYGEEHDVDQQNAGFALNRDLLRDGTKSAMNASLNLKSHNGKWFIQTNYKEINRDNFMAGQAPSSRLGLYNYGGSHFIGNVKFKPDSATEIIFGAMRSTFENVVDYHVPGFYIGPFGGEIKNYDLFFEVNRNFDLGSNSLLIGGKVENEGQHDGTAYVWDATNDRWNTSKDEGLLFGPNISRMVYSAFAEDTIKVGDQITLLGGARYDKYVGFGNDRFDTINPRVAATLIPNSNWIFKALYASASRPPSSYEKLGVGLAPLFGNSGNAAGVNNLDNIKPEAVETFELSAIFKAGNFKGQVTPFYQTFKEKIEFEPAGLDLNGDANPDNDLQAINNGDAKVFGADLDLWYYIDKKSYLFFNASKFDSHDDKRDGTTLFIPTLYANAGINYVYGKITTNLNAFYRGERELGDQTINKNDAHFNANMTGTYHWTSNFSVYALIENLSDQTNVVPLVFDGYGVPMRGRNYHVGLRWTM